MKGDIFSTLIHDVGLQALPKIMELWPQPLVELQNNTLLENHYRAQFKINLIMPLLYLT